MKLEIKFTEESLPIGATPAEDIPLGTVFFGVIKNPGVFLKVFEGVVDLQHPGQTWSYSGSPGPKITDYRPATIAKLTVG